MARALWLAVALVLLSAPAANAYTEPSGKLVAGSEETALRLHDLAPGYQVGDDSGCGPLGPAVEGDWPRRFEHRYLRWVLRNWPEGCIYQYEQIFAVPGLEPAPPLVEAGTLNNPQRSRCRQRLRPLHHAGQPLEGRAAPRNRLDPPERGARCPVPL